MQQAGDGGGKRKSGRPLLPIYNKISFLRQTVHDPQINENSIHIAPNNPKMALPSSGDRFRDWKIGFRGPETENLVTTKFGTLDMWLLRIWVGAVLQEHLHQAYVSSLRGQVRIDPCFPNRFFGGGGVCGCVCCDSLFCPKGCPKHFPQVCVVREIPHRSSGTWKQLQHM